MVTQQSREKAMRIYAWMRWHLDDIANTGAPMQTLWRGRRRQGQRDRRARRYLDGARRAHEGWPRAPRTAE